VGGNSLVLAIQTNDSVSESFYIDDCEVRQASPTVCFDGSPRYIKSSNTPNNFRTFMWFNFSTLIFDSINNATLKLTSNGYTLYSNALNLEFYYCNNSYPIDTCFTWNNQSLFTNCSAIYFYNTTGWNYTNNFNYTFDVTDLVKNESLEDKAFSIKIIFNPESYDSSARQSKWYSRETTTPAYKPALRINYELPITTTSSSITSSSTTTTTTIISDPGLYDEGFLIPKNTEEWSALWGGAMILFLGLLLLIIPYIIFKEL